MTANLSFTVSEYISSLNAALKILEANIVGEVIKVTISSKGHVYFTLKDKEQDAVIDCVLWAYDYRMNDVKLESGLEVIVSGSAQLYAPTGRLSFHTKTIELVGEGVLKKAYQKLKHELEQEGLLAPERKRPIPNFPHKIGVITSKQGAVIHDFLNNLGNWGFAIKFVDSRVEGKEALLDILQSIKTFSNQNLDVLIIMRGGGSMQSLAAFDNVTVVRAIANFPVPVIVAIGHHQDVPLAALVADSAPSTPTAAAHLVSSSWDQAEKKLASNKQLILSNYQEILHKIALTLQLRKETISENFAALINIFSKASDRITKSITRMQETAQFHLSSLNATKTRLMNIYVKTIYIAHDNGDLIWHKRIKRLFAFVLQAQHPSVSYNAIVKMFDTKLQLHQATLVHCEQVITLNNPLRLLNHGYSIIKNGQRLVKHIEDVKIGDGVDILVSDGTIQSSVIGTTRSEHKD